MSRVKWDETGIKKYQQGVQQTVLYVRNSSGAYPMGVPWVGVTGITESGSGAEVTPKYADNQQYGSVKSLEKFGATLEAFQSPVEFDACDGSIELVPGVSIGQQKRSVFGLAYRTEIGNDAEGDSFGYLLHLIYGCEAAPSEKAYTTMNDSPDMMGLSWEITTTPVPVTGFKPTACMTLDSTLLSAAAMKAIEDVLYGTDEVPAGEGGTPPAVPATVARLPLPDEVKTILTAAG